MRERPKAAQLHVAAARRDSEFAVGFVAFDESGHPVSMGGWPVEARDYDEAVRKSALAGVCQSSTVHSPDEVVVHSRLGDRALNHSELGESFDVAIKSGQHKPPEHALARSVAGVGFNERLLWNGRVSSTPNQPVRVYADGSELEGDPRPAASFAIVDDCGVVIDMGAERLPESFDYLSGEFVGLASGLRRLAALRDVEARAITDNRTVVASLSGEQSPPRRVAREWASLLRSLSCVDSIDDVQLVSVHETNRDYNQFADALAEYAHHREVYAASATSTPVNFGFGNV